MTPVIQFTAFLAFQPVAFVSCRRDPRRPGVYLLILADDPDLPIAIAQDDLSDAAWCLMEIAESDPELLEGYAAIDDLPLVDLALGMEWAPVLGWAPAVIWDWVNAS